jgi:uncharacterized protein
LLTQSALFAITVYQRFISPHKGFCCAYRIHTGRAGCSKLGYRAISRYGVFDGIGVLKMRLQLCGAVYRECSSSVNRAAAGVISHLMSRPKKQRGDCDPGISGDCLPDFDVCDGSSLKKFDPSLLQCCDCGNCGTDRTRSRSKKAQRNNQAKRPLFISE